VEQNHPKDLVDFFATRIAGGFLAEEVKAEYYESIFLNSETFNFSKLFFA
jgi:hypothetical protein